MNTLMIMLSCITFNIDMAVPAAYSEWHL